MSRRALYLLVLVGAGLAWGSTQSLGKLAASTGHGPWGLILWQQVVATALTGALVAVRGAPLRLGREALTFAGVVAVIGVVIPNTTFYLAVARLPAGIMSIVIATIPLMALPLAVAIGRDRFDAPRVVGLVAGLGGVAVIAAPGAALPDPSLAPWLLVALVGPAFYAMESNFVAAYGTAGLDPLQAIFLASLASLALCLPLAALSGEAYAPWADWGADDAALLAASAVSVAAYVAYVWLAREAGAVFASQLSYLVTASGLLWAMMLLGERFPPGIWAALALMLGGLALVRPRRPRLAGAEAPGL